MVQGASGWQGVDAELQLVGSKVLVGVWSGLEGARECGFRVKAVSQSSFSLMFPIQGIIVDCDIHHFS